MMALSTVTISWLVFSIMTHNITIQITFSIKTLNMMTSSIKLFSIETVW